METKAGKWEPDNWLRVTGESRMYRIRAIKGDCLMLDSFTITGDTAVLKEQGYSYQYLISHFKALHPSNRVQLTKDAPVQVVMAEPTQAHVEKEQALPEAKPRTTLF